jgi:hypothetical protein
MIKLTGRVFITTLTELNMKEGGLKICSMVRAKKLGLMEHATQDYMKWVRNKARVGSCGQTKQSTKESFGAITLKDMGSTLGRTKGNIVDNGRIIRCMVPGYLHGQMGKSIEVLMYNYIL